MDKHSELEESSTQPMLEELVSKKTDLSSKLTKTVSFKQAYTPLLIFVISAYGDSISGIVQLQSKQVLSILPYLASWALFVTKFALCSKILASYCSDFIDLAKQGVITQLDLFSIYSGITYPGLYIKFSQTKALNTSLKHSKSRKRKKPVSKNTRPTMGNTDVNPGHKKKDTEGDSEYETKPFLDFNEALELEKQKIRAKYNLSNKQVIVLEESFTGSINQPIEDQSSELSSEESSNKSIKVSSSRNVSRRQVILPDIHKKAKNKKSSSSRVRKYS